MAAWLDAATPWYGWATSALLLALAGLELARGGGSTTLRLITNLTCWIVGGWAVSWLPGSWFGSPVAQPFTWLRSVGGDSVVIAAGIVALDLFSYAMHRFEHHFDPLWRLHAVHHADVSVDASTGVRHHPGEAIVVALVGGVLFGALGLPVGAMTAAGTLMVGWALIQHADLPWAPAIDRVAAWVMVTPGLHRIHHSELARHHGANFGTLFSVWDRLFGTLLQPDGEVLSYGIGAAGDGAAGLAGTQLLPLRIGRTAEIEGPPP